MVLDFKVFVVFNVVLVDCVDGVCRVIGLWFCLNVYGISFCGYNV